MSVAQVLPIAWLIVGVGFGAALRPRAVRTVDATEPRPAEREPSSVFERFGVILLGRFRRQPDPIRARQVGGVVLVGVPVALFDVRVGLVLSLILLVVPITASRRESLERGSEVLRELPEVVDLLTVAVAGGLTVPLAVAAVAERVPGLVAAEFDRCVADAALGRRLADQLDSVPDQLGDASRPLIRALVAAERYGTPVVEALARVSADLRTERRRQAEIAARRLPVKLLFPLVACVLPAFVLLTVVPILAGSIQGLRG